MNEVKKELNELDLIRKFVLYGTNWCKQRDEEFSISLKVTPDGAFTSIGFSNQKIEEDDILRLLENIDKNDEIVFLNKMHQELNELMIGFTPEEAKIIQKVQDKVNKKFHEIAPDVYPNIFD